MSAPTIESVPSPRRSAPGSLLIVSPVRNEGRHVERVVRAMAAQTRRPDRWIVIDDGSEDDTLEQLRRLEPDVPFMTVLSRPQLELGPDRLARAAEVAAFQYGLDTVTWQDYDFVGKLDGDIELPGNYFEGLLQIFATEPTLGIAGGTLLEREHLDADWQPTKVPSYHVRGALKLYTRECFQAIGGMPERLGWDTIDETYARMRGYSTRTFPSLVAMHHRPVATAQGRLRGRARFGLCAYIVRYPLPWVLLRSLKVSAKESPRGISGLAFIVGYLRAMAQRSSRVEDEAFARFVRRELYSRLIRRTI